MKSSDSAPAFSVSIGWMTALPDYHPALLMSAPGPPMMKSKPAPPDFDDVLSGSSGDNLLVGESGNDTLLGRGGNDVLEGGSGDNILDGGEGNDTLVSLSGNDVLTGGSGSNKFIFRAGQTGDDIITDFDPSGSDIVILQRTGFTSLADLIAAGVIGDGPDGVIIEYTSEASVTLLGVSVSDLSDNDFAFTGF